MIFNPSPGPRDQGIFFFAVARPISVNEKLKSYEVYACHYIQWGPLGLGPKLLSLGPK